MKNSQAIKNKIMEVVHRADLTMVNKLLHIDDLLTEGLIVTCYKCQHKQVMYHSEWIAVTCNKCDKMIKKNKCKIKYL